MTAPTNIHAVLASASRRASMSDGVKARTGTRSLAAGRTG